MRTQGPVTSLFVLLVLVPVAKAQAETITEKYERAVVFLRGTTKSQDVSGAGLHVSKGNEHFLVSAQHVAVPLTFKQEVLFRDAVGRTARISLRDIAEDPELRWFVHERSDLAVLRLKASSVFTSVSVPIVSALLLEAPQERPVTMMGFPFRLGIAEEYFSPITKEVRRASGLVTFFLKELQKEVTVFLLDDPSTEGFSGGPVFLTPSNLAGGVQTKDGSEGRCIGIISGVLFDKTGGKFATVVPASIVVETINQASRTSSP